MTWVNFLFFILAPSLLLWPHHSLSQAKTNSLSQGQQLHDWEELVSAEGVFKLGFFSPGSKSFDIGVIAPRFIGIWFNEIPFYPLWVAKPEYPIPDSSGVLSLGTDGILKIAYEGGSPVALSSNQAKKPNSEMNVTATLLDSGNLVVREISPDGKAGPILWQSFDYPSNILLPEMKLGFNLKTGHEWYLTSWLSDQVPSPGAFKLGVNPNGSRELMVWRRGDVYWRSGEWKNGKFELAPDLTKRVDAYEFRFVTNENESYFSYSKKSDLILSKWLLDDSGGIQPFTWDRRGDKNEWIWDYTSPCSIDYYMKNATGVCISEKPTKCRNDSEFFAPMKGYMNMSFNGYYGDDNAGLALSDCHSKCWTNCTCTAYKSYYENGTGCQFWSRESNFIPSEGFSEDIYLLTYGQSINGTSQFVPVH